MTQPAPQSAPARVQPRVALIVATALLALAAGVTAYTLNPGVRYERSEAGLRQYLADVQKKQFEYQTRYQSFAAAPDQLTALGLARPSEGFTIESRGSSPTDYCWVAKVDSGTAWFTVSKAAVVDTKLSKDGVPPVCVK